MKLLRQHKFDFSCFDMRTGYHYFGTHPGDGSGMNIAMSLDDIKEAAVKLRHDYDDNVIAIVTALLPEVLARLVLQYTGVFGKIQVTNISFAVYRREENNIVACVEELEHLPPKEQCLACEKGIENNRRICAHQKRLLLTQHSAQHHWIVVAVVPKNVYTHGKLEQQVENSMRIFEAFCESFGRYWAVGGEAWRASEIANNNAFWP